MERNNRTYYLKFFSRSEAYSLMEMVVTIIVASIGILGIVLLLKQDVTSTRLSSNMAQAQGLIRLELAKINALDYDDATLADGYNNTTSNYEGSVLDLNRQVSYVFGNDSTAESLKEIEITVAPHGGSMSTDKLANLITYRVDNVEFGSGESAIIQADYLDFVTAAAKYISKGRILRDLDYTNTHASVDITITHMRIAWAPDTGQNITQIKIRSPVWDGTQPSDSLIDITDVTISPGSLGGDNRFSFDTDMRGSTYSVTFTMADGSTKDFVFSV